MHDGGKRAASLHDDALGRAHAALIVVLATLEDEGQASRLVVHRDIEIPRPNLTLCGREVEDQRLGLARKKGHRRLLETQKSAFWWDASVETHRYTRGYSKRASVGDLRLNPNRARTSARIHRQARNR
jgi:hypothetical protein